VLEFGDFLNELMRSTNDIFRPSFLVMAAGAGLFTLSGDGDFRVDRLSSGRGSRKEQVVLRERFGRVGVGACMRAVVLVLLGIVGDVLADLLLYLIASWCVCWSRKLYKN